MGEGFTRVGTKLDLSKEIYTLMFIANLTSEVIEDYVCVVTA